MAGLLALAMLDGLTGPDETWRVFRAAFALTVACALPWRRSRPLAVFLLVTLLTSAASVLVLTGDVGRSLPTGGALGYLFAAYALWRWASGAEAIKGLAGLLPTIALTASVNQPDGLVGWLFTGAYWMFPVALGLAVRSRADVRESRIQAARQREREHLARDLHDTVAHHVSAIVIQAQAARAVAATRPAAAADALKAIEAAASGALSDMRTIVEALRDRDEADVTPQPRLSDIHGLAGSDQGGPRIDVHVSSDLSSVAPQVQTALYRLAQESVSNARRHARDARKIVVRVDGDGDLVHLTVSDDGRSAASQVGRESGYGLVGMKERAALLGGTLTAGPDSEGGWLVHAELPASGRTS